MRLTVALTLILVVMAGVSSRQAPPLEAHALLVAAEPPVNAVLSETPGELVLHFSEPLEQRFSKVAVVDQDGASPEQTLRFDEADSAVMRVQLGAAGPGFLVVSWETVSVVDGHRITGSYPITILNEDGTLPAVEPPQAVSAQGVEAKPSFAAVRLAQFVAAFLVVGALLFVLFIASAFRGSDGAAARLASDRRSLRVALVALLVIASAALGELLIQAANVETGLGDVLATQWGERWLIRHALFGVTLAAVFVARTDVRRSRLWPAVALACAAAGLGAISSTSHAAAGAGAFWATAIDFTHLFAASVWLGTLGMLALLFRWASRELAAESRPGVLQPALQRFSAIAVVSLALLLLTGLYSAGIEVARLRDFVDSGYGRTLLLKLALILPLLAMAGYNAYVLRPRYASNAAEEGGRVERLLRRTMATELGLALAVLLVAAFLVQITPTRVTGPSAGATEPFAGSRVLEDLTVSLAVNPARPGFNAFEVELAGETGFVEQVRLEFFDRSGGTSESRLELTKEGDVYSGQGPFLDKAGDWQIRVNIRQSRDNDLSFPFDVALADAQGRGSRAAGTFDLPVAMTTTRALLAVLGLSLAALLVLASWAGGADSGGVIGRLARRLRRPERTRAKSPGPAARGE